MCAPALVAALPSVTTSLEIASAVVGFVGQMQQSDAQQEALNNAYKANMDSLALQRQQTDQKATEDMSVRGQQAKAAEAKMRVAAGESGISGISVDRADREAEFNKDNDIASIIANRNNAMKQNTSQGYAEYSQLESGYAKASGPSWLGLGLRVGGAYYADTHKAQPNNTGAGVQIAKG